MSQLGKQIRKRFLMESDYLTFFPGDMSPDLASPGTPTPYLVVTSSSNVVSYNIYQREDHFVETMELLLVAETRHEAENCLAWIRHVLKAPSWLAVAADGDHTIHYWRIDSFTDGADVAVDGDDSALRTVSLTITGNFKYTADEKPVHGGRKTEDGHKKVSEDDHANHSP